MKSFNLVGVLCAVTNAFVIPTLPTSKGPALSKGLIPRAGGHTPPGGHSGEHHVATPPGYRTSEHGDGTSPPRYDNEDYIQDVKNHKGPTWWKGGAYKLDKAAEKGKSGVWVDLKNRVVKIFYGDDMKYHASSLDYFHKVNPGIENNHFQVPTGEAAKEQDKIKADHREEAFRAIGEQKGMTGDEKNFASLWHHGEITTLMLVPHSESQFEGAMVHTATSEARKDPDNPFTIQLVLNWDKESTFRAAPLRGKPDIDGYADPKVIAEHGSADSRAPSELSVNVGSPASHDDASSSTLSDINEDLLPPNAKRALLDMIKRYDTIGEVQHDGEHSGGDGSTENQKDEYQGYLTGYNQVQAKVINTIIPHLTEMVKGSTYSGVNDAALSIYADLTFSNVRVEGAFRYGSHFFDQIEQVYRADLDKSDAPKEYKDKAWNHILAVHQVLIAKYNKAWKASLDDLKKDDDLWGSILTLADWLSAANKDVIPKDQLEVDQDTKQFDFLLPGPDGKYKQPQ